PTGCEFVFARREQRFIQASNKFTVCHKRFYSMNPADLSYKYNTQLNDYCSLKLLDLVCTVFMNRHCGCIHEKGKWTFILD
ncbi:hypothetical protein, partial [Bacteroides heparinolyticus]|uniref:hypothetical protein n=1 Tax=Prevotella heparinolytica TaxID=28113 RepID=UPI003F9FC7FE